MTYPVGTRVHHRGQLWTAGWSEAERQANPQWGWGTVMEAIPQRDKSTEYRVEKDAPLMDGGKAESWWASYHIDETGGMA